MLHPTGFHVRRLLSPEVVLPSGIEEGKMANQSIISESWEFLKIRKRYWLLPIVMILFLLSMIMIFTEGSVVAPFIYALF
jgi:hypothetical protein